MHSVRVVLLLAALGGLMACSSGDSSSAAFDQPGDKFAPAAEKVHFSALARDMIAVPESEAAWDVSEFNINMDIEEYAEPTEFDDLIRSQP